VAVSIGVLSERFGPSLWVEPWGECLVIQGTEFNPEWEFQLGELGFNCYFGIMDNYVVTFVQLKKENRENKKQATATGYHRGPNWTPEEEKLLVEVINDATYGKNRPVEIAIEQGKFAGRTASACVQRYEKIWPKILEERKKRAGEMIKQGCELLMGAKSFE
jgi:Myb-like DNA-binding domain.